jgi:Mg2+-importing ATPase
VQNVSKYVLMGSSSNFGNMFSMAGAALFLPFLPMLPIQILLNNLLYYVSEIAIPFDRVDEEATSRPVTWNVALIERFRGALPDRLVHRVDHHPGAGRLRHRTRRLLFRSSPHRLLTIMALGAVAVAIALLFTPVGRWFGLVAPPPLFFVYLIAATAAYLALVEITKIIFYRSAAGR